MLSSMMDNPVTVAAFAKFQESGADAGSWGVYEKKIAQQNRQALVDRGVDPILLPSVMP